MVEVILQRNQGKERVVYQGVLVDCEVACGEMRVFLKKIFGHNHIQHSIAQELQSLIGKELVLDLVEFKKLNEPKTLVS